MLKVIDLDVVTTEDELLPIIRDCLRYRSVFLLKNYANMDAVQALLSILKDEEPDVSQGFDQGFSGAERLENGICVEQFVGQPGRLGLRDTTVGKLTSRLIRVATFFAKVSLASVGESSSPSAVFDEIVENCYAKVIRFHKSMSKSILGLNFDYDDEYRIHSSPGIISVFPAARGIKYKINNGWQVIDEPDCILIQTGSLLSHYSNNTHITDPIQFSTANSMHLTIFPDLQTNLGNQTVFNLFLSDQIQQFPQVAQKLYPRDFAIEILKNKVEFCKNIFNVTDSVLSLYSISRSLLTSAPELRTLLPQISNMLKRKVSQEDFLRMMTIWHEAYTLGFNSNFEMTLRPPSGDVMNNLSNKSRKLEYTERAAQWFLSTVQNPEVPCDVPVLNIRKRRGSDNRPDCHKDTMKIDSAAPLRSFSQPKRNKTKGYLSNTKDKFLFKQDAQDAGNVSLLERIREKERRAAALLSQRERQHELFLDVKTSQIFNILFSLPQDKPYTLTHLTSLIIDSLCDSNNPIGESETHQVLARLQNLLPDRIHMVEAEGSLKVYRWVDLDKSLLVERMKHSS
ncbi:LAME_0D05248g1_1 [Lachancea meyersii CBS 8951]|uniref:LAME_0D05248g1_1 n=1 Tax=Lachancea meyersii CBS 8951 TaxID=1266667 RepID=A0A1G4J8J7_9SACH|nr:LAME_0D05248g1_1 [Lachancea meyersii CBS 8951]